MPSDPPLVSVVIPTYNYGRYVTEAVDSALAQTYRPVEVIVVDDGSTDDTRERLSGYGDRIRYVYQENAGLSAARNTGIRNASGGFVAFLDSDDAFHPRKLQVQMGTFARDPSLGLVGTLSFSDEPRVWADVPVAPASVRKITLDEKVVLTRFSPSSAVARRECFEAVGDFDTSLRSVEDRDMWIRIAARYPVARVELPLTWYRLTPGSMSRNAGRMEHAERVVLDKAFRMPELAGRWKLRRRAWGYARSSWGYMHQQAGNRWTAVGHLARSILGYPLPYGREEVRYPLGRLRLLLATLVKPTRITPRTS